MLILRAIAGSEKDFLGDEDLDRDEALKLLKGGEEGIREWNQRRASGVEIPDLSSANLHGADLCDANLCYANLRDANLHGANLCDAILSTANLRTANLRDANLSGADLSDAILTGAILGGANLGEAQCGGTIFADVAGLSKVSGLDSVKHEGPSTIGIDTLFLSQGKIPEAFLRRCGLKKWEILTAKQYDPDLTPVNLVELQKEIFNEWCKGRSMINGCFISYSWANSDFVDKLFDYLQREGIPAWLDCRDMVTGRLQLQIWREIQFKHVLIIVLSKDSVASDWVENELDMARQKEKAENRDVICPIALDDAWKSKIEAKETSGDPSRWLWRTLQQKYVVPFHGWETTAFDNAFEKLVRGLNENFGPGEPLVHLDRARLAILVELRNKKPTLAPCPGG